ncbi:MAG: hypothetical protein M3R48_09105 [Candidatus Dormibacteraeota bacterium]|nr:hypothetical protein [Candidatus Dormibacteraeota bacterium]
MSTSTLVLNFVGWFVLTVVVSAVAVGVPWFLDRPTRAASHRPLARTENAPAHRPAHPQPVATTGRDRQAA